MKCALIIVAFALGCAGCDEKSSERPDFLAEEISLEEGQLYHLRFGDAQYEILVGGDAFTVMRYDGFMPFTAMDKGGEEMAYEIRTTDGSDSYFFQDLDGDGLPERRLTYPNNLRPGTSAKIESIAHEFTLERPLTLPPSEQGGARQPATAPESKPEGDELQKPESKGRPQ